MAGVTGLGVLGNNGFVTGTAGSAVVIKGDATARAFTGTLQGALGLDRSATNSGTVWTLTQNEAILHRPDAESMAARSFFRINGQDMCHAASFVDDR